IFDHHTVEFVYSDGTRMLSQCRQTGGCLNRVAEFVEGTEGEAELNGGRSALTNGDKTIWRPESRPGVKKISPYQVEHNELFCAIVNDRPHHEVEQGAYSTMPAILGRLATYSGKAIQWDDALKSN